MSEFTLNAQERSDLGKGASRRLRRNANLIPAVIYGAGKEAASISLENREMAKLLLNEAAFNSILTLKIGSKKEDVLIKDLQRHPAKGFVLHADFIRVVANQKLTALIPVTLINEENCVGVKRDGGELFRPSPELEVSCLPKDLPDTIEVDVANLEVGQVIHVEDIKAPKGVEFVGTGIAVVTVTAARVSAEEDEVVEAADAAEEAKDEKAED
ncbi:50S ribosomal protein L25/general stress protein Ctc [Thiopseudomonas acetoxidans]|uniref:Large ribosomal subunit protein bL25 n=1 Tax=Thiopseudomonas acetoxidans TaxID=3041622 RepID=A0ABT7SNH1_9GAMM|nr:50S ribosomal protein L25/general stress protein Ctc [Thiopseudomonas sp. CY1220]MDM7857737.1 50S ribosomal protein L25/general stress protein Ctc [Thiopseudomonas sp. CY1220]